MSADPGRRLALDILLAVQRGERLPRQLQRLRRSPATAAHANAAEELIKGALQWQGRYDHLIARFSRRRPPQDPIVRGVLLLALHQLLASRGVPHYAALHQAGELLRDAGRPRAVPFVNAVLQAVRRHLGASSAGDPLAAVRDLFPATGSGDVAALAAWWSHPPWLVGRWCARYGPDATAALLRWANTPPPLTLHVLPGQAVAAARAKLAAAGCETSMLPAFPRALRLTARPDRARLRELLQACGALLVQDAGAQAVVDWLTRDGADLAGVARPVVDLCAAPGGKAMHLRSLLAPACPLVALDLRPRRLALVRENRDRLGLDALALAAGDGSRPPLRPASCEVVLLDGPCSGTGVGRRHPEGRWRLRAGTLPRYADRLLRLARAAADLLVDGGRLYYATCSLEREENEDVVAALLAARDDLVPDPGADGRWERAWWPWRDACDGFYAARLRRRVAPRGGRAH